MKVLVFGLGYVGFTAACCIAKQGHFVIGIDVSEKKVSDINSGIVPFEEPNVYELMTQALASKTLQARTDIGNELDDADVAIICVGTPSSADGSHNMTYIIDVSRQIAEKVSNNRDNKLTVIFRSTFRPGTIERLIAPIFANSIGKEFENWVELVYNPEFLRESTAVHDYFSPPKVVIGTKGGERCPKMEVLNKGIDAPLFTVKWGEAEFTKFVDNSWHAVKVAFANEIGRICTELTVSASAIHSIFKSDTKLNISAYYTRPGGAFGGSCLPKDVRALQYISADVGTSTPLVDSLLLSNEAHKDFWLERAKQACPEGGKVLLIGLTFKTNTDDLRESPNVDLARKLLAAGYDLMIYDPSISPRKLLGQNLGYAYSNLPRLEELLVSLEIATSEYWDLVIDANGSAECTDYQTKAFLTTNTIK